MCVLPGCATHHSARYGASPGSAYTTRVLAGRTLLEHPHARIYAETEAAARAAAVELDGLVREFRRLTGRVPSSRPPLWVASAPEELPVVSALERMNLWIQMTKASPDRDRTSWQLDPTREDGLAVINFGIDTIAVDWLVKEVEASDTAGDRLMPMPWFALYPRLSAPIRGPWAWSYVHAYPYPTHDCTGSIVRSVIARTEKHFADDLTIFHRIAIAILRPMVPRRICRYRDAVVVLLWLSDMNEMPVEQRAAAFRKFVRSHSLHRYLFSFFGARPAWPKVLPEEVPTSPNG